MTLSTPAELQARYDTLTARIAALDREIGLEIDRERRMIAQTKRDELAHERESIAGDMMLLGVTPQQHTPIEHRVTVLERDVGWLKSILKPGPRAVVGRVVFYGLLVAVWSMWMVKEVRDWLIFHPAQAITLTLVMVIAALIIRWLPEDDHDQR